MNSVTVGLYIFKFKIRDLKFIKTFIYASTVPTEIKW